MPSAAWLFGIGLAACVLCSVAFLQPVHAAKAASASAGDAMALGATGLASLERKRRDFLRAEQALGRGDHHRYLQLRQHLRDYPLYPYLVYADLTRRLATAEPREVHAFIRDWRETPLPWQLRVQWLRLLAKREQWSEYVRDYRPTSEPHLQCAYLRALLETGQVEAAMQRVPELWTVGKSQPKACDAAFEAWIRSGGVARERAWQRVRLAMEAGRPQLARYLRRFLSEPDRQLVQAWLRVRARPERVAEAADLDGDRKIVEDILVYGVARLARRNPDAAATAWSALQPRFSFSAAARDEIYRRLALAYAYQQRPEAEHWFAQLPEQEMSGRIAEWRVLNRLRHADWPAVLDRLERLDAEQRAQPR